MNNGRRRGKAELIPVKNEVKRKFDQVSRRKSKKGNQWYMWTNVNSIATLARKTSYNRISKQECWLNSHEFAMVSSAVRSQPQIQRNSLLCRVMEARGSISQRLHKKYFDLLNEVVKRTPKLFISQQKISFCSQSWNPSKLRNLTL